AAQQETVEQEVLQADLQRFDAMVNGDEGALDRLLAPEVTYITSGARIEDKRSILYNLRTKATSYRSIIATERKVRTTGSVGVVTGVSAMRGVERRLDIDITTRYTAVFIRRDGRWQLTAFQATQLLPGGRAISGEPPRSSTCP